jgi:hypothetical protein
MEPSGTPTFKSLGVDISPSTDSEFSLLSPAQLQQLALVMDHTEDTASFSSSVVSVAAII